MAGTTDDRPVWARPEAFPLAEAGWGWVDRKGRRVACPDFETLAEAIVADAGARVDLVWTPDCAHLVLPEQVPELHPALRDARLRWAEWEIGEGIKQMQLFGLFLAGFVVISWLTDRRLMAFGPVGLALLLFVILGLIPWYQGRKRLKRAKTWAREGMAADVPEMRFEVWMMFQKTPVTRLLLGLIVLVGLVQWLAPGDLMSSISAAGLTKFDQRPTDWWRLMTAPMMHGHWIHLAMNASALAYLGRRMEVLAKWPHVALVMVLASWVGGEASSIFVAKPSVGASGGLMGMLGFLLVFESLHRQLVPESARRRLLTGVVLTGVIGLLGFRFIDNAAHAGGLLAGVAYAFAMFPKSASSHRPRETPFDRAAGGIALGVIVAAALLACVKIL